MMTPLVLAIALAAPAAPPEFTLIGKGDESPTGTLTAMSLTLGAQVSTPDGAKVMQGLVGLRKPDAPIPALPTGAQLITASGDRIPGEVRGGDAKVMQFRPSISRSDWRIALDAITAVWLVAPPADTPTDPSRYAWLDGTPTRDVLLYRNGDAIRGALNGFTETGVRFTPDGGPTREVERKLLAAIGFNPRFVRARKPKDAYAHLVLDDGTRLDVIGPAVKKQALVAKAVCGPELEVPLSRLVALDVLQGSAVYLSELKPKKAETVGFLGADWPWTADRTVRGRPLRLFTKDGESTFDKGLGTHPKTTLTYDLAGKYTRFEAFIGLDAATGKRGRASVRVQLDGKDIDLPDLKSLAAGPGVFIRINVKDAKELTLVVDFGPTGDVQADVNWGAARLVGE
jgi:NPCBM/NEW2 domain